MLTAVARLGPLTVIALAVTTAGCGSTGAPSGAAAPPGRSTSASGTGGPKRTSEGAHPTSTTAATSPGATLPGGATEATAPVSSASATAPTAGDCRSSSLQVVLDVQPRTGSQPDGRERGLIVITDLSASSCDLGGFVTLGAVETGVVQPVMADDVDLPSAPEPVRIEPDVSAFAGIEWTSSARCSLVTAFRVTPPGRTSAVTASVVANGGTATPVHLCDGGILIGPVAATSEGTVSFPDSERS